MPFKNFDMAKAEPRPFNGQVYQTPQAMLKPESLFYSETSVSPGKFYTSDKFIII